MNRHDWREILPGDEAPKIGGEELTERRRAALEEALRLMACTHPYGESCEHVDALGEIGSVLLATNLVFAVEAIRTLPRPLTMPKIEELLSQITPVIALGGGEGSPRGLQQ